MSGKKRGLSLEEKRQRMLEIFYDSKTFFNLKELEKIAPKQKGIVLQSVKDVVQSLIDDGYVDSEKVGTSIYYWALPSKALVLRQKRLDELQEKFGNATQKQQDLLATIQKIEGSRNTDDPEENRKLGVQVSEMSSRRKIIRDKLADCADFDPDVIQQEEKESKEFKDSANRWTDNIFSTKSWLKSKFNMEDKAINGNFGIRDDLDYVE